MLLTRPSSSRIQWGTDSWPKRTQIQMGPKEAVSFYLLQMLLAVCSKIFSDDSFQTILRFSTGIQYRYFWFTLHTDSDWDQIVQILEKMKMQRINCVLTFLTFKPTLLEYHTCDSIFQDFPCYFHTQRYEKLALYQNLAFFFTYRVTLM